MSYRSTVVDEFRALPRSQLTVYYVEIGKLWEDDYKFETALRLLPFKQQTKVMCKRFSEDARTALANQLLQRFICCVLLNTTQDLLSFTSNEYGKPQLEGCDFQFSMSNQQGYTSMVICQSQCGIDLASCSDVDKFGSGYLTHFKDIFHREEHDSLLALEDDIQTKNIFTHYWALKESYTKLLGVGLNGDLKSYNFGNVNPLRCDDTIDEAHETFKLRLEPAWDSSPTLCIEGGLQKDMSIYSTMLNHDIVVSACTLAHLTEPPSLIQVSLESIVKFFTLNT